MSKGRRRRLLTIGHSYVVGLNRRLADEIARTGEWDVTVIAPTSFRGDFAWHYAEAAAGERCRLLPVPVFFGSRVHLMLYGRAMAAALRSGSWDLVHVWEEPYVAAAAQIVAAVPRRTPLVFATFQNINKTYPPPFNWIERYALRRANGVVAFGETIASVLRARGYGALPTRVIPPGVDAQRFAPDAGARAAVRAELGWDHEVPVVGFLGRLVPQKGVRTLMAALDAIDAPWRALIAGAGPLDGEVRAWAERYRGRVFVKSAVPHDEVPRWLNAMDVLCAPSQTTAAWREQFGRMLIEAFACGVPVVASDSGEIPSVVGEAGIIVPEGDTAAWQSAISRVLGDAALREQLSARGRVRALSTFDWPVVARAHAEFFAAIAGAEAAAC